MAERAHPDDAGFQEIFKKKKILGLFPVKEKLPNPYRDAVFWRYEIVNQRCVGKHVLDVPCGMGWGTSMLSQATKVSGLDISEQAIDEARERYGINIDFQKGSMASLPFSDGVLDVVSCLEGIEHVPQDVALLFLAEAHRVLVKSGLLIVSSPHCTNAPHSGNPYHVHEYQPEELRKILERHFGIVEIISREVDNLIITVFVCSKK